MRDTEAWRSEILEWSAVKIRPSTLIPFLAPGKVQYAVSASVGGEVFSAPLETFLEDAVTFSLDRILIQVGHASALSEAEYSELFDSLKQKLEPIISRIINSAFIRRGVIDRETGFGHLVLRRALSVLTDLTEDELIQLYRTSRVEVVLDS
ncbi:MAG: hypothetical protein B6A08_18665 [Sorangiineae bacterium NIC37A_2]|jgi:hypothetical protein|nr:MAG: hypothetical protein B6A08_18665 [Sorangiineae bacterium NIC37A_2]